MTDSFTIRSIEAFCYRYPLAAPVMTSFGPAVFVRAVDEDGVASVKSGTINLGEGPGLDLSPDLSMIVNYRVL